MTNLVCILLLAAFTVCASGDWEMCGPGGDRVYHICNFPGAVFAAVERTGYTGYECFKSIDGGERWEFVSDISAEMDNLIADSHQRLIGWKSNTITISYDQGENWSTITLGPEHYLHGIASDPLDSSRFLAIRDENDSSPLLESCDGGVSWFTVEDLPDISGSQVEFSTCDPDRIYFAGTRDAPDFFLAVYSSTDGGITWTDVSPNALSVNYWVRDLVISPFNADVVFLCYEGKILRSVDGGNSWTMVLSAPCQMRKIAFHPSDPDSIFACTTDDVYHTGNGGLNWWISPEPCDYASLTSLAVSDDVGTRIHIGSYDGIALSVNGGYAWSIANEGIPGGSVFSIHEGMDNGFPVFSGNGFFLNEEQYSWELIEAYPSLETSHISLSISDPDLWFMAGNSG